jgi:hypothetical protein
MSMECGTESEIETAGRVILTACNSGSRPPRLSTSALLTLLAAGGTGYPRPRMQVAVHNSVNRPVWWARSLCVCASRKGKPYVGRVALSRVTLIKRLQCQKCDMNVSRKRVQQLFPSSDGRLFCGSSGVDMATTYPGPCRSRNYSRCDPQSA